ncbi:hypothetical protein BaRGS_00018561 [Batillaria attramentaria]|uniref:Uncharacterized protein n=1 Tax=Batillaria attramentaria TaxID=370345 RepID=A0ABD0KT19_9CAEN
MNMRQKTLAGFRSPPQKYSELTEAGQVRLFYQLSAPYEKEFTIAHMLPSDYHKKNVLLATRSGKRLIAGIFEEGCLLRCNMCNYYTFN